MSSSPVRPAAPARAPRRGVASGFPTVAVLLPALLAAARPVAGPVARAEPPAAASAQVVTVDEGSFTVTRAGGKLGREEFRILRQPSAGSTELVARALGAYGDRRVSPALQTDAEGTPLRYQVEVRTAGTLEQRLTGQLAVGHFNAQVQTPRGEAAREYLVSEGAVVIDDEVWHQYYFLALGGRLRGATAEVPVLVPRRNVQVMVRATRNGAETVAIGGRELAATRWTLTSPDGPSREVWFDGAGRVLRVRVADRELVAQRDDPPR